MAFLHLSRNVKNVTVAITMSFAGFTFLDVCDLEAGLFNSCCLSLMCVGIKKKKDFVVILGMFFVLLVWNLN